MLIEPPVTIEKIIRTVVKDYVRGEQEPNQLTLQCLVDSLGFLTFLLLSNKSQPLEE